MRTTETGILLEVQSWFLKEEICGLLVGSCDTYLVRRNEWMHLVALASPLHIVCFSHQPPHTIIFQMGNSSMGISPYPRWSIRSSSSTSLPNTPCSPEYRSPDSWPASLCSAAPCQACPAKACVASRRISHRSRTHTLSGWRTLRRERRSRRGGIGVRNVFPSMPRIPPCGHSRSFEAGSGPGSWTRPRGCRTRQLPFHDPYVGFAHGTYFLIAHTRIHMLHRSARSCTCGSKHSWRRFGVSMPLSRHKSQCSDKTGPYSRVGALPAL